MLSLFKKMRKDTVALSPATSNPLSDKQFSSITYLTPDLYKGSPDNLDERDILINLKSVGMGYKLGKEINPHYKESTKQKNRIFYLDGGPIPAILKVSPKNYVKRSIMESNLLNTIEDEKYVGKIIGTYVFCDEEGREISSFILEKKYMGFEEWRAICGLNGEELACKVMSDILKATNYIHTYYEIIHRDLKPENLVVRYDAKTKEYHVILIDFNVSRKVDFFDNISSNNYTKVYSEYFYAPEIFTGNYDHRIDIYAIGSIGYYLLTNQTPSGIRENALDEDPDIREDEIQKKIKNELEIRGVSKHLEDIILKAVKRNPNDRYTTAVEMYNEMADKLMHMRKFFEAVMIPVYYKISYYKASGQIHWIGKIDYKDNPLMEMQESQAGVEAQKREIFKRIPEFKIEYDNGLYAEMSDEYFERYKYIGRLKALLENPVFSDKAYDLTRQSGRKTGLIKKYDVITFEDDEKLVALASTLYKGDEYAFMQGVLPDESDVIDVYKIMVLHPDGTMEKVVDPFIISEIAPIFQEILENEDSSETQESQSRSTREIVMPINADYTDEQSAIDTIVCEQSQYRDRKDSETTDEKAYSSIGFGRVDGEELEWTLIKGTRESDGVTMFCEKILADIPGSLVQKCNQSKRLFKLLLIEYLDLTEKEISCLSQGGWKVRLLTQSEIWELKRERRSFLEYLLNKCPNKKIWIQNDKALDDSNHVMDSYGFTYVKYNMEKKHGFRPIIEITTEK